VDRFALFIDAGHLLAEGGKLCIGSRKRSLFDCDYPTVVEALTAFAAKHSSTALLRVYWYDGAYKGIPSLDHLKIAGLDHVKLRLGRMSGGKQKGVDSLIVRDLMVLGRERAIATAYVLAGDEDLREGVRDCQEFGVRVVLLGIRSLEAQANQAETLIQESDEHIVLEDKFWKKHFTAKPGAEEEGTNEAPSDEALMARAREIGTTFANEWVKRAANEEALELLTLKPVIPRLLDSELLASGRTELPTREKPWLSKHMRVGFWDRVTELLTLSDGSAAAAETESPDTSASN
jgi:uncharacterized LabA/DUF88 family protein